MRVRRRADAYSAGCRQFNPGLRGWLAARRMAWSAPLRRDSARSPGESCVLSPASGQVPMGATGPALPCAMASNRGAHSCHFVTVQLPFTDLRSLMRPEARLPLPSWPDPNSNKEFVRRLGQVRDRKRGGIHVWPGESSYCSAGRILSTTPKQALAHGYTATAVYCRLFGTAYTYRLDIGFVVYGPIQEAVSRSAIASLLLAPASIDGAPEISLADSGPGLSRAILARTTPHSVIDASVTSEVLLPGRPLVLVERAGPDTPDASIGCDFVNDRGVRVPVYYLELVRDRESPQERQIRGMLWRLHSELEALRAVQRVWRTTPSMLDLVKTRMYLDEATAALVRERREGVNQPVLLAIAEAVDGFQRTELAALADQLRQSSLGIARRIDLILERTVKAGAPLQAPAWISVESAHIYNVEASTIDIRRAMAGNEYNFKGPASGIFGNNARSDGDAFSVNSAGGDLLWGQLGVVLDDLSRRLEGTDRQVLNEYVMRLAEEEGAGRTSVLITIRKKLSEWGPVAVTALGIVNQLLGMQTP
jgi:hypothetical protein